MEKTFLNVQRVVSTREFLLICYQLTYSKAIIGAGVSGVAAAVHLRRAGIDVKVFERSTRAGGIWYAGFVPVKKSLSAEHNLEGCTMNELQKTQHTRQPIRRLETHQNLSLTKSVKIDRTVRSEMAQRRAKRDKTSPSALHHLGEYSFNILGNDH